MNIVTVLGTRPEIIKMSPLIPLFDELGKHIIVHSGQHYSKELDAVFFEELELRKPDYFLGVGSIAPASQVAKIAEGVEKIIMSEKPDWVVVHGDTNTTLGGALAAVKHRFEGIRLAHVEAGARSFNEYQPEELNRVLVDRMADLLFAPTKDDVNNLLAEGISEEKIILTGNTVIESCRRMAEITDGAVPKGFDKYKYALCTIHRQETVDNPEILCSVWSAVREIASRIPVIFPVHPRADKMLRKYGMPLDSKGLHLTEPVGYRSMITLLKNARFCMTDSGGLQEEAAILGVPALVLRDQTEHRRYVESGLHSLTGITTESIIEKAAELIDSPTWEQRRGIKMDLDVDVSQRIIDALKS